MIVGHFVETYLPALDGVIRVAQTYREHMQRQFGASWVVAPSSPGHQDGEGVIRFPSLPYRPPYRMGLPRLSRSLPARLGQLGLDIVHSHGPFTSGVLAHRIARQLGRPLVFSLHSRFPQWSLKQYEQTPPFALFHWLIEHLTSPRAQPLPWSGVLRANSAGLAYMRQTSERFIWRYCQQTDCVLVPTERARRELLSYADACFPEERQRTPRIELLLQGIDFPEPTGTVRLRERYGFPPGVPVLLYVGQLAYEKELPFLLDALAALQGLGQDFRMLLVGGGAYRKAFEARATELGIGARCTFTGPIADKALLAEHYSQADLFLFPSLYETQGLVVMEAASCGLPTVAQHDAPGIADVLRDGETGFFSARNPQAYAHLVATLCSNLEHAKVVGQRARRCVVRVEKSIEQLVGLYAELRGDHSRSSQRKLG